MQGDGHWSGLGRDILNRGVNDRTMNFGQPLVGTSRGFDTSLHEIGHTLGLPHEHQNPFAGMVWDEEKVYEYTAQPPNNWSRERTHWNILRKIEADTVQGSSWDVDSVMHYPFAAGLILQPEKYRTERLQPAGDLSARDVAWVRSFYPVEEHESPPSWSHTGPKSLRSCRVSSETSWSNPRRHGSTISARSARLTPSWRCSKTSTERFGT